MIRCFECPLREVCQVAKVTTTTPERIEWIPDNEKEECPLYRFTHASVITERRSIDG